MKDAVATLVERDLVAGRARDRRPREPLHAPVDRPGEVARREELRGRRRRRRRVAVRSAGPASFAPSTKATQLARATPPSLTRPNETWVALGSSAVPSASIGVSPPAGPAARATRGGARWSGDGGGARACSRRRRTGSTSASSGETSSVRSAGASEVALTVTLSAQDPYPWRECSVRRGTGAALDGQAPEAADPGFGQGSPRPAPAADGHHLYLP